MASSNEQMQCDHHRYAVIVMTIGTLLKVKKSSEIRTCTHNMGVHYVTIMNVDCKEPHDVYTQDGLELATMDGDCEEPRKTTYC